MREIIRFHAERYPLMGPADAVKLIYQNEFGIGHLIPDRQYFTERLDKEMDSLTVCPDVPLTEPIGGGLVRVMLNSPESFRLKRDELISGCLRTAAEHQGCMDSFLSKLSELEAFCREGLFGFSSWALDAYLEAYRRNGCPPVSHTQVYRDTYHPAYRVISENFFDQCKYCSL